MSYIYLWDELLENRNNKLIASDWTQLPDSPLSAEKKAEWAAYRQALRDLPQQWSANVNKETTNPLETLSFPKKPK